MQTFLPYQDFAKSAQCLDRVRLGKQRSECKTILRALLGESKSWMNHPVVKMWRGHEAMLCCYAMCCCSEYRRRGFADTLYDYFHQMLYWILKSNPSSATWPSWMGGKLHSNHRAKLLAKLPDHYQQFEWMEKPSNESWYPVEWSGNSKPKKVTRIKRTWKRTVGSDGRTSL